jgi:hypothetical protein
MFLTFLLIFQEEREENESDAVGVTGPGEVGTLYPDLNTIVEGNSRDEASRENSKSLVVSFFFIFFYLASCLLYCMRRMFFRAKTTDLLVY